jgi:hypothetical protein
VLRLSTSPRLNPAYGREIRDYTVACEPGETVQIHATVPRGQTLAVNSGAALRGSVSQSIPLRAGQAFEFTVTDASGSRTDDVRCTPADFPTWVVRRQGKPEFKWVIFSPRSGPYAIIADNHGVPIWWMKSPTGTARNASVLPDGTVTWWNPGGPSADGDEGYYRIYRLDGTVVNTITASASDGHGEVGANLHDLEELPNGDFVLIAYVPRSVTSLEPYGGPKHGGVVLDAVIQEVAPSGALLWSWDSADYISPSETDWRFARRRPTATGQTAYDIIHMNSIQEIDTGGCALAPVGASPATCNIVFSARHLDAVYSISMATGKINWKLGGTNVPGESLAFVNDPYGDFGGQHYARVLPNGLLSVHDNGTFLKRPPRIVVYRLGPHTATLVQRITDSRVTYSGCCGSDTPLSGGDWLIDWGGNPLITELTPAGFPVFTITFPPGWSYRALPVTSSQVTRSTLIAGMNAIFLATTNPQGSGSGSIPPPG